MRNRSNRTAMTTRNLDRTAPALALLLLAGCHAVGAGEDTVSIEMKAEMSAPSFLTEQTVQVRLTLENRAANVVSVPNPLLNDLTPEYIVTDPHGKQTAVTNSATHIKIEDMHDPEAPPSVERMDLPPRGRWSELIPLDPMLPLNEPGPYRLQVAYTADKDRLLSPAMEFRIMQANVTAFAVTAQGPDARGARLSTTWAHGTGSEIALADAVRLGGLWGKDAGGKLYSSVVYRGVGAPAGQIAVPAMYGDRGMDFVNWVVWEQDGKVQAQRTEAGEAKGAAELVYAGAPKAVRLIHAPVMDRQHNLRVFLVEADGQSARLMRIDLARSGATPARVAYRVPLPAAPVATQAVHFRENGQDHTLIFCLTADGGGMAISAVADGPSPKLIPVVRLENEHPLPGNSLAAYTREDGRTYVAAAMGPAKSAAIHVAMGPGAARARRRISLARPQSLASRQPRTAAASTCRRQRRSPTSRRTPECR